LDRKVLLVSLCISLGINTLLFSLFVIIPVHTTAVEFGSPKVVLIDLQDYSRFSNKLVTNSPQVKKAQLNTKKSGLAAPEEISAFGSAPSLESNTTASFITESTEAPVTALPEKQTPISTPALLPDGAKPPYPAMAIRRQIAGTVFCLVDVDKTGSVNSVRISQSSGSDILDRSALSWLKSIKFRPATQSGHEIPFQQIIPITFRMD